MAKGYIRILEAIMLIIILFSLMLFIMQNQIITPPNPSNPNTLARYSADLVNVVCNSEMDRERALSGDLSDIYKDLVYMTPPDYKVRIVVNNTSYGPSLSGDTIYSNGCIISNDAGKTANVTVQVWV